VLRSVPRDGSLQMMALGGDVRFAASQLLADWEPDELGKLPFAALEKFTSKMLQLSPEEIVQKYHTAFPDAETVGPALLAYVKLARALKVDQILVTNVNLRDG